MQRVSYKTLLTIIIILLIGIVALLKITSHPDPTKAAWFDDTYGYRQRIDITNSSGSTLTDFQISLSIGTSALINSGKMQSDCDDIRITDSTGKLLPHWIDTGANACNLPSVNTNVWTKLPTIPTSGTFVYLYYGNPIATNIKSGDNVFEFFDDFTQAVTNKWNVVTGTASTGINQGRQSVSLSLAANIMSKTSYSGNFILETDAYLPTFNQSIADVRYYNTSIGSSGYIARFDTRTYYDTFLFVDNWSQVGSNTSHQSSSGWHHMKITVAGGNHTLYNDGSSVATYTNSTYTSGYFGLMNEVTSNYYGPVIVRKYASADPTTNNGSEEKSPAPVAYYKFDEGVGTSTFDSSSHNYHGNLANSVWKTEDICLSGKCLSYNGTNSYTTLGGNSDFSFQNGDTWTVSLWFKTGIGITGANGGKTLFTKGVGNAIPGYAIVIGQLNSSGYDNKLGFVIDKSPGNNYALSTSSLPTINDNQWHQATLVFDAASNTNVSATIYLDGKSYGSVNSSVARSGWATTSSYKAAVGANNVISPSEFFNGFIDETKIYNYARTSAQIQSDYNSGKGHQSSSKGSSANLGNNNKSGEFLSNGLVGYWKMDENIGTTLLDASGNNYTVTLASGNSSPTWSNGKFGVGTSFDGNDYATGGNPANINTATNITISAWVKTGNSSVTFANSSIAGNSSKFFLSLGDYTTSTPRATGYVRDSGGSWGYIKGNTAVNDGNWHMVTMTYDGSSIKVFHNGQIDSTPYPFTGTLSSASDFYLGAYTAGYPGTSAIDEVRIYNRALSSSEISQLYNWTPGPVQSYSMDENQGTTIYDNSGTGYTGIFGTGNSSPSWTTGKYGNATKFNGTTQYIGIPDVPSGANNSLTLESWINPSSLSAAPVIIDQNWGRMLLRRNGSELSFSVMNTGNTGYTVTSSGANLQTNTWTHVAATMDNSTNTINVFKNGVLLASVGYTGPINHGGLATIGAVYRGQGSNLFDGSVDEVKIYNYARTPKQIVEDMNAGHPSGGSPVGSQILYWKMDEGQGSVANNSNGNTTFNGTLSGATLPTWNNNAKFGKSLYFAGTGTTAGGNGADVASATSLHDPNVFGGAEGGDTVTFWINPSDTTSRNIFSGIGGWYYFALNSNSTLIGMVRDCAGSANFWPVSLGTIPQNQWTHVAAVLTGQGYKIYLNGKLDNSVNNSNLCIFEYGGPTSSVGKDTVGWDNYAGYLDEFKVYSGELTADEIKQDYNRGQSIQLGSLSSGTGNTAPSNSSSQLYCVPGDTTNCSPPVGEWNFDEAVGTTAYDSSSNNYSCTLSNSTYKPGKIGNSLSLSGSSSYASCGTTLNPVNPITFEGWVNINSLGVNNPIISKDGTWLWYIRNSGGTQLSMYGVGVSEIWAPYTFNTNTWYFVSSTIDSSGNVKHYINGQQISNTQSGVTTLNSNANAFTLGKWSTSYLNGQLDQVKVFNYVRSPAQIALDYNRGAPIAQYKFDDCQGNITNDSSGIGNTGNISIGPSGTQNSLGTCQVGTSAAWTNGASGKYNSGISLDGNDDYVTTPMSVGGTEATISFWVKNAAAGIGTYLFRSDANIRTYFQIVGSNFVFYKGNPAVIIANVPVTASNWNHVVMKWWTSSGTTYGQAFINGKAVSSPTTFTDNTTGTYITVGGFNSSGTQNTSGIFDDVRVYSYALTDTQIKTLYSNGNTINFAPSSGSP